MSRPNDTSSQVQQSHLRVILAVHSVLAQEFFSVYCSSHDKPVHTPLCVFYSVQSRLAKLDDHASWLQGMYEVCLAGRGLVPAETGNTREG